MENICFVMTISGTTVLLLYYLAVFLLKGHLKAKWKRTYLIIVMFFYLIPLSELKYVLIGILPQLFISPPEKNIIRIDGNNDAIFITNGVDIAISLQGKRLCFFYLVCVLIAVCIFAYEFRKLINTRKILEQFSFPVSEKESNIMKQIKLNLHIRKKVVLAKTNRISTPLTAGIITPLILLPADIVDDEEFQYIVRHELAHIRHKDIAWNLIGVLVVAIHWFNPFAYAFLYTLTVVNEQYSDEEAVEDFEKKARLSYCSTLINIAGKVKIKESLTGVERFSGGSHLQIKRRIDAIMCKKKKNVFSAIMLGLVLCVSGGSAAFAYETPILIQTKESALSAQIDFEEFIPESKNVESFRETIPYDDCFVSTQGEVYQILKQNNNKAACNHTFVSGTRKVHTPQSGGGCTMKYYEAKRCSLCGFTQSDSLIKTELYPTCLH